MHALSSTYRRAAGPGRPPRPAHAAEASAARPAARGADGAAPPVRRLRRVIGIGIAAHLAWQVALPLGYYLAGSGRDERFAWRIFSALAIAPYRCDVRVRELAAEAPMGRDVDLSRTLHDAWTAALRQGQDAIVDRFLRTRCRSSPLVEAVEYARFCRRPDGAPAPYMRVRLDCASGAVGSEEEMR